MSDYEIQHQAEEHLFFVVLEDGQRAYVRYSLSDTTSAVPQVDFLNTFVPESHRRHGLAAQLVEHCFAWAEQEGLFINTSCWYAAKKLQQREQNSKS